MVFGMAKSSVSKRIGKLNVPSNLVEHSTIQPRIFTSHAPFEFFAAASSAVHKKVEINHIAPLFSSSFFYLASFRPSLKMSSVSFVRSCKIVHLARLESLPLLYSWLTQRIFANYCNPCTEFAHKKHR
uniref:Uncharacterized protein n=1 Tax=uncultured Chromatiales bacterium HF0200_41F04 TaxID=710740 RepID=E0XV28_9GAMM|nr:hypothetical protein [uncultured Chromatiales bacterium HF0200_41F04]